MALAGEFDILLVFMFDRLGRKDDETPFVVEWFVNQASRSGARWSGQQRSDTHVGQPLNYIRYRQASGESIKTSARVKIRIGQLTEQLSTRRASLFPYGYRLRIRGAPTSATKRFLILPLTLTRPRW